METSTWILHTCCHNCFKQITKYPEGEWHHPRPDGCEKAEPQAGIPYIGVKPEPFRPVRTLVS